MPILNPGVENPSVIYNNEQISDMQMNTDASTMSSEDESNLRVIASKAGVYAKSLRKQKFYDFKTKNKSFLKLYQDLKRLGVKNNKFFLRLYDTDLQGVDVYAPVQPKEIQIKIFLECLINPWYWLREVLRIPTDGLPIEVGGGVQYQIDRNNIAGWYLFLNGIDHYRSKARQTGKTQDCVAYFNYAYHFGTMSSTMLFFNKDQDQANMNLYRLKCQRDMMPTWMQMRTVIDENGKVDKGIDNTKSIRNPVNGNIIQTMGKATSKDTAMKLGRGATTPLQYYDEFDFIPYQTEIMNAASFAYLRAAQSAQMNGSLYGRILSSTPGDLDARDGEEASNYVKKMLRWRDTAYTDKDGNVVPSMFDMPINDLKDILASPSYNGFVYVEHSWQQLGLPMSWYEKACSAVNYNTEVIMREIELKRIHGSSNSPFPRNTLIYLMNHVKVPIESLDLTKNLCNINIFSKIRFNKVYMMGVDTSEGLGQDNNTFTLVDPTTQIPVAEFKSPYISPADYCTLICAFLDRYCPRTMIVVENNRGRELINRLLETKYRYQVYYDDGKLLDKVQDKVNQYGQIQREAMVRRSYGIPTSRTNRPVYFEILENIVEERKDLLLLPNLVEDVCGLVRKPNGKVEAGTGLHDDSIMSYLIVLYVYFHASYEKLEEYGIRRGASDDIEDYDDNGKLTEEGSNKKLLELLPSLPEELQSLIIDNMRQMDPVKEAEQYYREVQQVQRSMSEDDYMNFDNSKNNQSILPSPLPQDEAMWSQLDESIWESNFQDPLEDQRFNIDNLIE